jgi:hypothetical protein
MNVEPDADTCVRCDSVMGRRRDTQEMTGRRFDRLHVIQIKRIALVTFMR